MPKKAKETLKEKLEEIQTKELKNGQKATPELQELMFSKHLQITLRVAAITLGSIGIFTGGGYLLDMKFATKPLFLILGLVISFPLSQFLIYKSMREVTNNIQDKYK